MPDSPASVTVKPWQGAAVSHPAWVMECSCGTSRVGFSNSDDATRAGATHLYRAHGIYAGGHKPTMEALTDE